MRNFQYILMALLVLWVPSVQAQSAMEVRYDGSGGRQCPVWLKYPDRRLCKPGMIRLVARSEDYDERFVSVTGFLKENDAGVSVLFPSREIYLHSGGEGGIELDGSIKLSSRNCPEPKTGCFPVTVVGKFSVSARPRTMHAIGLIIEIDSINLNEPPRILDKRGVLR